MKSIGIAFDFYFKGLLLIAYPLECRINPTRKVIILHLTRDELEGRMVFSFPSHEEAFDLTQSATSQDSQFNFRREH